MVFEDEFETPADWQTRSTGIDGWRALEMKAHSGTHAWGTSASLTGSYSPSTVTSLLSPVIDLSSAPACRLFFYQILDIGSEFESDLAEIFVRDADGNPLAGAPNAFYQAAQ